MGEIKPVAWRSKDYSPLLEGQFAWAFTANDNDLRPDHEPLYDQQAIDTLQYRLDTSNIYGLQCDKDISDLLTRAESAEAEADALRKDAQRYRWLRDSSNPIATQTVGEFGDQELDEAIDAYIQDSE